MDNKANRDLSNKTWMNVEEAARFLSISVGALRNLTSTGKIPYYKLGNRNRYLAEELHNLLLAEPRGERKRHGN